MTPRIEVRGLRKTFFKRRTVREIVTRPFARPEPIRALRGVDLEVREGETLGLLGPNGAGKTTLLKILSCLVLPDEGSARVAGFDVEDEYRVKPRIGLVHSDERSFYWRLSARENLRFFARLYDVPREKTEARIDELLARVDLVEAADRPFSGYSSGMKQRVAIARALLHDPPILLMDEPTRSLDPASSLLLRHFIEEELKGRGGKTIVLATHHLKEAEALSDRVAILARGKVRHVGTVEEIRRWGVRTDAFRIECAPEAGALDGPFEVVERGERGGHVLLTCVPADGDFDRMMRWLVARGVVLHGCERVEQDLEQAFSRILESDE